MNAHEAGQLLALLAALDRREVDRTTAQGWAWALDDVPLDRGVEAAKRALDRGVGYVDINAIRAELKAMQPRLEADVRSAKLRGIVPDTWPKTRPLTGELEQQLRAAHVAEWAATNDRPDEGSRPIRAGNAPLGQIGHGIPDTTITPRSTGPVSRPIPRKRPATVRDPATQAAAARELDHLHATRTDSDR